jgi:DNA-binding Lrp family transcriptional regulator
MQQTIARATMRRMESAYVMINCELGSEGSIMEQLRSVSGVIEVQGVFGNYDILAKIQAPSVEHLRDMITFHIRKIPQIYSTTTIVCSKILA